MQYTFSAIERLSFKPETESFLSDEAIDAVTYRLLLFELKKLFLILFYFLFKPSVLPYYIMVVIRLVSNHVEQIARPGIGPHVPPGTGTR